MLLLPAVPGEGLPEVAVPVEESYADQRHPEVAGRLEVVSGEDAQAAGVLRQGGGDAELGGEVSDGGGQATALLLVPAVALHIGPEVVRRLTEQAQEPLVGREFGEPRVRHGAEEPHRVPVGRGPAPGVHGLEEVARPGVPGPAQVTGQLVEGARGSGRTGRTVIRRMAFTFSPL